MIWQLKIAKSARKNIARFPRKDQEHIHKALREMAVQPLMGDVVRLKTKPIRFRRRVVSYRIFFRLDPENYLIGVSEIDRRTTTTYRRR